MTESELKYVLTILNKELKSLTKAHGSKGRAAETQLMSPEEISKAKSIEKSVKILKEFGTLNIDTEDFIGKDDKKMRDLIKKFN